MKFDASICPKTPEDIRRALEARPEWLHDFSADFMRAAAEFDSAEIAAALDKWHPMAVACLTPGYLEEHDALMARINAGDTEGLVFYDDEGRAWDLDNNRLPMHDKSALGTD